MVKRNTSFKGDGGLCINVLITNSKFSFIKTNSFETGLSDHHHMIYSKQNLKSMNQRNQYTAISNNMVVINLNWIFLIVCVLWEPMQPLKITLFQFQTNILKRKQKFYKGIKNPILIRTFGSKWWSHHVSKTRQIIQKILLTLSSLNDNETCWQIWINQPNFSTLRNVVLIIVPNHFRKHVNRKSQVKTVIYKKIQYCLKR